MKKFNDPIENALREFSANPPKWGWKAAAIFAVVALVITSLYPT